MLLGGPWAGGLGKGLLPACRFSSILHNTPPTHRPWAWHPLQASLEMFAGTLSASPLDGPTFWPPHQRGLAPGPRLLAGRAGPCPAQSRGGWGGGAGRGDPRRRPLGWASGVRFQGVL